MRVLFLISLLGASIAFAPQSHQRPAFALFSTANVPIAITGDNLEVTPALEEHLQKRIGRPLSKLSLGGHVKDCGVILSVSKNPKVKDKHRVEVVTSLKGTTIICTEQSPDMYSSIDAVSHALHRKLLSYKERRVKGHHDGHRMGEDLTQALEAFDAMKEDLNLSEKDEKEEYVDPEKPTITKVKSFDLEKPISLDEAIFALDYVDHDFYVFRNSETDKITVVYKRNVGGVGLIEP